MFALKKEYPDYIPKKFRNTSHKRANSPSSQDTYKRYKELHSQGMSFDEVAKALHTSPSVLHKTIDIHITNDLIQCGNNSLVHKVQAAVSRREKFDIINEYRAKLINDYGKTLLNVPVDEPRLTPLQLASRAL